MGYAIADAFANAGSEVVLISGPTSLLPPKSIRHLILVRTSDEMYEQCCKLFNLCDIIILSAAVADYKPQKYAKKKLKSTAKSLEVNLVKTVDIAYELGKKKRNSQMLVGFALETDNEMENAREKMNMKNFDLIVLNSLNDEGAGFGHDTNKITIIDKNNKNYNFRLKQKREVASDILKVIAEKME
jgi:phosphopantothenoylcysteine decarboxylase/phosphopantothenate--cysteine ligase